MRVVCISDTHLKHNALTLPAGDVLVHAGDATTRGNLGELALFAAWFERQPHQYKLFVPGNHDVNLEHSKSPAWQLFDFQSGITVLMDSMVTLGGVRFYGAPWTPRHGKGNWAFHYDRDSDEAYDHWARIPDNLDVLITHGPPQGHGDFVLRNPKDEAGCNVLLEAVERTRPRFHVFGHLHEGYGQYDGDPTTFINAAICDDWYEATHEPIVFDIEGSA